MKRRTGIILGSGVAAVAALALVALNLAGLTTPEPAVITPERPPVTAEMLCGPYALQRVLFQHGRQATVAQIAELAGTDEEGTTMLGLAAAAERLGLRADGWEASIDDLRRFEPPLIAHFSSLHWVVVDHADTGQVIYWDPAYDETVHAPIDDFTEKWSGYVLTLLPQG